MTGIPIEGILVMMDDSIGDLLGKESGEILGRLALIMALIDDLDLTWTSIREKNDVAMRRIRNSLTGLVVSGVSSIMPFALGLVPPTPLSIVVSVLCILPVGALAGYHSVEGSREDLLLEEHLEKLVRYRAIVKSMMRLLKHSVDHEKVTAAYKEMRKSVV